MFRGAGGVYQEYEGYGCGGVWRSHFGGGGQSGLWRGAVDETWASYTSRVQVHPETDRQEAQPYHPQTCPL